MLLGCLLSLLAASAFAVDFRISVGAGTNYVICAAAEDSPVSMVATTAYAQGVTVKVGNWPYLVVSNGTAGASLANIAGAESVTNGTLFLRRALQQPRKGLVVCNRTSGVLYLNFGTVARAEHGVAIDANGSFSFSFPEEISASAISIMPTAAGLVTGLEW